MQVRDVGIVEIQFDTLYNIHNINTFLLLSPGHGAESRTQFLLRLWCRCVGR